MMLSSSTSASGRLARNLKAKDGPRGLVLVAAKGGGNQKNRGLYFEYEAVDPDAHKQLPVEKAKVQEEFAWVRRARGLPTASTSKPKKLYSKTSGSKKQPAPKKNPPTNAADSAAATPAASSVAAAAVTATAAVAATAAAVADKEAAAPEPTAASASAQAAASSSSSTPQAVLDASAPAATTSGPANEARAQPLPEMELPALPPVLDASNVEEQQVRNLLSGLLQLNPDEVEQLSSELDFDQLSLQTADGQADFTAWLQQVREAQSGGFNIADDSQLAGPGLQISSGNGAAAAARLQRLASQAAINDTHEQDADQHENDALLADAAAAEAGVSALLSGAGQELQDFKALLSELQSEQLQVEGQDLESIPPVFSEEHMLAELSKTDPELYKLLTAGDGLDYSEEETRELERAMASLAGLGTQEAGQAVDDSEEDEPVVQAQVSQELNQVWGLEDEDGDQQGVDDEDEELSDAELQALADSDPDLAALLRSNTLGKNFEKLVGEEDGEGEEDGDLEEGLGFSDLFDAIDEDPDLDDSDRERAKMELQSMFNMAGRSSPSEPAKPFTVTRGVTTTGSGDPSEAVPVLLPKPSPRK